MRMRLRTSSRNPHYRASRLRTSNYMNKEWFRLFNSSGISRRRANILKKSSSITRIKLPMPNSSRSTQESVSRKPSTNRNPNTLRSDRSKTWVAP